MKKFLVVVLLIGTLLFTTNCASLLKGTSQAVNLHSRPPKAEVYINGQFTGYTPLKIHLDSNKSYIVEFRLNGERKVVQINKRINAGWVILDIFMGFVPVLIDLVTGAWYELDKTDVVITF